MTSSRVVRGTKGRIVLCVCAILIITGVIACYNNTLSQLDDVRRTNDQCHQQQENLSTQLQVIFDYKQRLEKSLKTEKAEHQQNKKELENRIDEERIRYEKTTNEANLKFSSLQQHYNLLQTQHDDFKEECSKIQQQQLNEINDVQSKFKEVQGQLKQSITEKENSFEHLKSQFLQLEIEKDRLEKQVKGRQGSNLQSESDINHLTKLNHELQRELDKVKEKCSLPLRDNSQFNLQKQSELSTKTSLHTPTNFTKQTDLGSKANLEDNVADLPSSVDEHLPLLMGQLDSPKIEKNPNPNYNDQSNINENVLPAPNSDLVLVNQNMSTTKSNPNIRTVSKAHLDAVQPLHIPDITHSSVQKKTSQESPLNQNLLPLPYSHSKRIPAGVLPVPDTPVETVDDSKLDAHKLEVDENEKGIRDDVRNAFPNRYRSNLIANEMANEDKAIEADKQVQRSELNKNKQSFLKSDVADKENNALEVYDSPVNEKDKHVDGDPFGIDNAPNGAKLNIKQLQEKLLKKHANGLDLEGGKILNEGDNHKLYDGGDYDKDVPNDMQLEENDPEAEDDDPEYGDHIGRPKDPAVRN